MIPSPGRKVLAFGTFDILHPGHERYLAEARQHGELHVVVARDRTVEQVKGRPPRNDERTRLARVRALPVVNMALLGSLGDKFKVIERIRPDVIVLGYDQAAFTAGLQEELARRGLRPSIIRACAYEPQTYKSSKL